MAQEAFARRGREDLQLLAVREILRATSAALPLDDILSVIASIAIIVFEANTSWFMLAENGRLRVAVARGEFAEQLADKTCPLNKKSITATAALADRPVIIKSQDIKRSDPVVGVLAAEDDMLVLLPLKADNHPLGLLGATIPPSTSFDISFLITMAQQASSAIESARLREESRAWRQRLDAVFERMAEPVLVFDRDAKLALMNDSARELLSALGIHEGDPVADLIRQTHLLSGRGRPLKPQDTAAVQALSGRRVDNLEEDLRMPDGNLRHFLNSAVPIQSEGRVQGAVVVWRDITYIKELESQRAEFLSMISHELRTPLTSILGYAQILQREVTRGVPPSEMQRPLAAIADQVRRVNSLVEDLLDASRAEVGRLVMKFQEVNLVALISKTVTDAAALALDHRFDVDVPSDLPPVRGDPGRVEQVLRNLLSNAAKYSPPNTTVSVRAQAEQNRVVVSVSDQGSGIAREDVPNLFLPFHRVRQVGGREVKGVGLGLFISRSIVEALGGEIWVHSEIGKGSAFYFSLPLAKKS